MYLTHYKKNCFVVQQMSALYTYHRFVDLRAPFYIAEGLELYFNISF